MGRPSLQTLLLEAAENRGYAKGHSDGRATGRVEGREQGTEIVKRQVAKALQREGMTLPGIAKITDLPIAALEFCLSDDL